MGQARGNRVWAWLGVMMPKLSTRTDMISEAINPIYPDLDVDPDFYEKEDI